MKKFNDILTLDTHQTVVTKNVFNGKIFVITGTLSQSRSYFQKIIEENGGVFSESLGKSTNFLLMGEKAGSKEDKAKKLDTKILSENEFLEMLK